MLSYKRANKVIENVSDFAPYITPYFEEIQEGKHVL